MTSSTLLLILAGLAFVAFSFGRNRAIAGGAGRKFHSLPGYYGGYVALWCVLPALALFAVWQTLEPTFIRGQVLESLPAEMQALPEAERGLILNDIRNLVEGNIVAGEPGDEIIAGAERYSELQRISRLALSVCVLVIGLAAFGAAIRRVSPAFRARNSVERTFEY